MFILPEKKVLGLKSHKSSLIEIQIFGKGCCVAIVQLKDYTCAELACTERNRSIEVPVLSEVEASRCYSLKTNKAPHLKKEGEKYLNRSFSYFGGGCIL